jgi:hypothetical protein
MVMMPKSMAIRKAASELAAALPGVTDSWKDRPMMTQAATAAARTAAWTAIAASFWVTMVARRTGRTVSRHKVPSSS